MLFNHISPQDFEAELDRIGADDRLQSGLAVSGGVTVADVVAALRATPTGGGTDAFTQMLDRITRERRARMADRLERLAKETSVGGDAETKS